MLALVLAITSFLGILSSSKNVNAAIGSVSQYAAPRNSYLSNIGAGPDGKIWFTSYGPATATSVGKVTSSGSFTEYVNSTGGSRYPKSITAGPDGNVWYSDQTSTAQARITKMSTSGTVLDQYIVNPRLLPEDLVFGSGGDLWFLLDGQVGSLNTTSGATTLYTIPWGTTGKIHSLAYGSDGDMWYAGWSTSSSNKHSVGKITPSGVFTNYQLPTSYGYAQDITAGPDGNLWFTTPGIYSIFKMTTSGVMTQYVVGVGSWPYAITAASDGNLWYVTGLTGKVGRITPAGTFTEYTVPGLSTVNNTKNIVAGADGAVWIYDSNQRNAIRVAIELTSQTISFTSTAPTSTVIDGPAYTPAASASSGLPVTIAIDPASLGVCSIDGSGVVSFQGAGTCTINANQAGDVDYKPAPQVQQSLGVLPVDADTSVSLDCPASALVGDPITCTITVANDGPAASDSASLTALLPNSLTGVSLSGGGSLSGQYVTWATPYLASGDSIILTLNATMSALGKQRFSAALLQNSPDPSNLNNLVSTTIVVN